MPMKLFKICNIFFSVLISIIIFGFQSCATYQPSQDRSEYQSGYNSAYEFAKKDALKSHCNRNPRYFNKEAKKYTKLLQEQGRSEAYIKGFYVGYKNDRLEFYDLYCMDDEHWRIMKW
jgi:hypothetical protein